VVTLREVAGDPEELAALQRIMESDEDSPCGSPHGTARSESMKAVLPSV
jgi:hypothetical protein